MISEKNDQEFENVHDFNKNVLLFKKMFKILKSFAKKKRKKKQEKNKEKKRKRKA